MCLSSLTAFKQVSSKLKSLLLNNQNCPVRTHEYNFLVIYCPGLVRFTPSYDRQINRGGESPLVGLFGASSSFGTECPNRLHLFLLVVAVSEVAVDTLLSGETCSAIFLSKS